MFCRSHILLFSGVLTALLLVAATSPPLFAELFDSDDALADFNDPLNWNNDVLPGTNLDGWLSDRPGSRIDLESRLLIMVCLL